MITIQKNIIKEYIDRNMSVAFLIPIYPKHYEFMYQFIRKVNNKIDIILIFSHDKDYLEFEMKDSIKSVVLENIDLENIYYMLIVNSKKMLGLNYVKNVIKYDYYIVCDAEIDIIESNFTVENIQKKIESIFTEKKIYVGNTTSLDPVMEYSATLFSEDDLNRIKKKTNNFESNNWWSDIPVIKKEHIQDYLDKIGFPTCLERLNYLMWDTTMYCYYLLIYQGFENINYTSIINRLSSLESYYTENESDLIELKKMKYGFSWVTPKLYKKHKEFLEGEGTFLLYHLDRE
uniref:Uncharacterized protein n=1 Tax=viral metagenome TaxID=1070528 RepID=A0A6C0ARH1_9ZZZZ